MTLRATSPAGPERERAAARARMLADPGAAAAWARQDPDSALALLSAVAWTPDALAPAISRLVAELVAVAGDGLDRGPLAAALIGSPAFVAPTVEVIAAAMGHALWLRDDLRLLIGMASGSRAGDALLAAAMLDACVVPGSEEALRVAPMSLVLDPGPELSALLAVRAADVALACRDPFLAVDAAAHPALPASALAALADRSVVWEWADEPRSWTVHDLLAGPRDKLVAASGVAPARTARTSRDARELAAVPALLEERRAYRVTAAMALLGNPAADPQDAARACLSAHELPWSLPEHVDGPALAGSAWQELAAGVLGEHCYLPGRSWALRALSDDALAGLAAQATGGGRDLVELADCVAAVEPARLRVLPAKSLARAVERVDEQDARRAARGMWVPGKTVPGALTMVEVEGMIVAAGGQPGSVRTAAQFAAVMSGHLGHLVSLSAGWVCPAGPGEEPTAASDGPVPWAVPADWAAATAVPSPDARGL